MTKSRPVSGICCPPRRAVSFLALVLLVGGLLPGLACKAMNPGVRASNAIVSPEWDNLNIQTLGLMTVGSSVGNETARQTAEYILEEQLTSSQDRFVVLGVQTARGRAAAAGAGDVFDKMVKTWRDTRMADKFLAEQLCQKMGVDGLVFGDLVDWKKERVEFTQEGSSYTQVALRLVMISGKTGLPAWESEKMLRRDTMVYTPGSGGSGVITDESGVARAQRPGSMTPEPPRPEDVYVDVLSSLFAAFPPRPAK